MLLAASGIASCAQLPPAEAVARQAAFGAARSDQLHRLIDRHLAWRGGTAYRDVTSVEVHQDIEALGLSGTSVEWRDRSGRSHSSLDLGQIRQRIWTGPDSSWSQTNGVVRDRSPDAVVDARRMTWVRLGEALLGRNGATLSLLPAESRDGRSWSVVRIGFGSPDTYDLFINSVSGELHGYRVTRNRRTQFTVLSDWRFVDGVRFPFLEETIEATPGQQSTIRVQRIVVNAPLDPGLATRPESRRVMYFTDASGTTGPLPFNYVNENRIYIPARVNGRQVEVILDSGADFTALDRAFAQEIGLRLFGEAQTGGAGGHASTSLASDVMIEIGKLRLDHPQVGVLDLTDIATGIGHPMPVILGRPAFDQLIVDIDFQNRTIAFHDPARFQVPAGATSIELKPVGGGRSVPASIEGGPPVEMQFDIGNSGNLEVFPVYWQDRDMLRDRAHSATRSTGVGGTAEEIAATVRSLDFAGVRFTDVPASFVRPGSGHDDDRFSGIIGIPILSRFRLMIDYPNDRLHLVPYADVESRAFPKNRTGLSFDPRSEGLEVAFVAEGSPAGRGGWRTGEVVAEVNGVAVGTRHGGRPPRLDLLPAGTVVAFKMADGSTRTLTLSDYF